MLKFLAQAASAASNTSNASDWGNSPLLAIFLIVLGLAFVVAEIFTVTFGLFTLCAISCFIGGLIIAFNAGPGVGIVLSLVTVIGVPVVIVTTIKLMPRTRFGRRLIPESPKLADVSGTGADLNLAALMGRQGRTMSMCRPAGTAEFDGKRFDVVSEGLTILGDRPVKVIAVEGNRVVVRELD